MPGSALHPPRSSADIDNNVHAILARQIEIPARNASLFAVYKYASRGQACLVVLGLLCSMGSGALTPLMLVVFGQLTASFASNPHAAAPQNSTLILYYVLIAFVEFVFAWLAALSWNYTGQRIARAMQARYLESVLGQNVAYHDVASTGKFATHFTIEVSRVQSGVSQKLGATVKILTTAVGGFVVAFTQHWPLALILSSSIVALLSISATIGVPLAKWTHSASQVEAAANALVHESIAAAKFAMASNMGPDLAARYNAILEKHSRWSQLSRVMTGILGASLMCISYLVHALGFWQGAKLLRNGTIDIAAIITTLLAVVIAAFSANSLLPSIQALSAAKSAAQSLLTVISRPSPLSPFCKEGLDASSIHGHIQFDRLHHAYPTRPSQPSLRGLSLVIEAGKTVALVGPSGSGKTTATALLQRFYEPTSGRIFIDGMDICDFNLASLRKQIAVVSQEPVLFDLTVEDNILLGIPRPHQQVFQAARNGGERRALAVAAAKQANAHEFIEALPHGYATRIGERGSLLSGGQRQRIAIARAIVSSPKILILDEATSALDLQNEAEIQQALEKACRGRTTVVIAHRLATIRHADAIAVLKNGAVVELGTHEELLDMRGLYKSMVDSQSQSRPPKSDELLLPDRHAPIDQSSWSKDALHSMSDFSSDSESNIKSSTNKQHRWWRSWPVLRFLLQQSKADTFLLVLGVTLSIIAGLATPAHALLFAKSVSALSVSGDQGLGIRFWSGMYLLLALLVFLTIAGHCTLLSVAAERLTRRLRVALFASLINSKASYETPNPTGELTALITTAPANATSLTGTNLAIVIESIATVVSGSIATLVLGWKLALVCIAAMPLVLLGGIISLHYTAAMERASTQRSEALTASICEYISGIRTVASLGQERHVLQVYRKELGVQYSETWRPLVLASACLAFASASPLFCFALIFWYGSRLIAAGEYSAFEFFFILLTTLSGAQLATQAFAVAPEAVKVHPAARRIESSLATAASALQTEQTKSPCPTLIGKIEFDNVSFAYAARPNAPSLQNVNLTIQEGQSIALVGPSGSGKTTIVNLVARLYEPSQGTVKVDGVDVTELKVKDYRRHIALVSQEPVLFNMSLRENLLLGLESKSCIADEPILNACKDANILEFIQSLPSGLDTMLGHSGLQLSGGQRQRLAIARALLRNPRILLLDEATSSLDTSGEAAVQEALERASRGRTTITVAHRLSTIQRADQIFVLQAGRVVESGTHASLVARRGCYYQLARHQLQM